jgi:hypothetical protein
MCIGQKPQHLPVGIVNKDLNSSLGISLSMNITESMDSNVIEKKYYDDFQRAFADLESGHLVAVIKIDQNFTDDLIKFSLDRKIGKRFANLIHVYMDTTSTCFPPLLTIKYLY